MKKIKNFVDVNKLEKKQPEELSRLIEGLETKLPQKSRDGSLWTQEFAATGKVGKTV